MSLVSVLFSSVCSLKDCGAKQLLYFRVYRVNCENLHVYEITIGSKIQINKKRQQIVTVII